MKLINKLVCFTVLLAVGMQVHAQQELDKAIIFQDFPFAKSIVNDKVVNLEKNNFRRSRSFSNSNDVKDIFYHEIYESYKASDNLKPIIGGKIKDFNMSSEDFPLIEIGDNLVSLYKIKYLWEAVHFESGIKTNYDVTEYYYVNNESRRILRVETWENNNFNFYGWGEHIEPIDANHLDVGELELFKIKRISKDSEGLVNFNEPENYLNYALLTKKGFYRFNTEIEKDSVVFSGETDSYELSPYNKIVSYKTSNGSDFTLIKNFDRNDVNYYVSSLDMLPFPNNSEKKTVIAGNIIVWEKCDFIDEWVSLKLKKKLFKDNDILKEKFVNVSTGIEVLNDCIVISARDLDEDE